MSAKEMPHITVEQVLALRDAAIKAEEERDALEAHMEAALVIAETSDDEDLQDWMEMSPATSLARRDAVNQALSLSRLIEHLEEWMAPPHEVIETIEGELRRLRRQAEGTNYANENT